MCSSGACAFSSGSPNPISTQVTRFENDVPHLVNQANHSLAKLQSFLDRQGIRIHVQQQGQTALDTLQKDVLKRSGVTETRTGR